MRKNHPLQRLRRHFLNKILASFAVVIIIIVGFTNLLILQRERLTLTDNLIIQGERTATFLAQTARIGVYTENSGQLQPQVAAMLEQHGVLAAAIFSKNGRLLIKREHRDEAKKLGLPTFIDKEIPQPKPQLNASATQTIAHEYDDFFLFWAPVIFTTGGFESEEELYFPVDPARQRQEIIGMTVVVISKHDLKHQVQSVLLSTIFGSIILSILCYTLLHFILRYFTRPLVNLMEEINTFGVTTTTRYDDLGVLTDTYSAIVEALTDSFETIHGMKKELEVKVAERTRELASTNAALAERQKGLEESLHQQAQTLRELQETQAHLVQSEKMAALGQVVAGVAHEVNNTVNFISNALPVLQRRIAALTEAGDPGPEKAKGDRQALLEQINTLIVNIDEGTKRTSEIVRDLQDFSRSDASGVRSFSIHEGLDSTLAIIHPEYRKRINITKVYAKDMPQIICNPGQINQVFMNVLLNAFQAIPGDGNVWISTGHDKTAIRINIKDDGPGIADAVIPKIFDPFFTTKEVGKGTGLGLGICYQIITKHHGEIRVQGNEGRGAEFEIILPLAPPEQINTTTEDAAAPSRPAPQRWDTHAA
ncbi:MAG: ATP-binding protein [Desulfobulbaceae bacterium]|nr:ATP-binding protein [Desulfobulbaceae bacterium]